MYCFDQALKAMLWIVLNVGVFLLFLSHV